jgi:hypothetical protein
MDGQRWRDKLYLNTPLLQKGLQYAVDKCNGFAGNEPFFNPYYHTYHYDVRYTYIHARAERSN